MTSTNVVFIDDDPDIAGVIKAVADCDCNASVEIFNNGVDALKRLSEPGIDIVILDLRLPVLDGLTIAEEIRRNEEAHLTQPPVKMAFLTGAEINDAVQRVADRVGIIKIFQKPCDYLELFREIKGWS